MKNQPYNPAFKGMENAPPPLFFPVFFDGRGKEIVRKKQIVSHEIFLLADGVRKIFTDKDALYEYGFQQILDPSMVSFTNLFINGVLQPKANYTYKRGEITLLTEDIPEKGCPIILQMIIL